MHSMSANIEGVSACGWRSRSIGCGAVRWWLIRLFEPGRSDWTDGALSRHLGISIREEDLSGSKLIMQQQHA